MGPNDGADSLGPSGVGAADPRIGGVVDKYGIVRLLGQGGMGTVYEARHVTLSRRFAIKFLLPELAARPEILRRFENEAIVAARLEHANLVAVNDVGRASDGTPYLVMEFLQGEDCSKLLRRAGPLPVPRAADIVLQACRGVAVAHRAGIVHRDLKPENLFLTDAGDGCDLVKVLDFGIAKLRPSEGQSTTKTGSTFGTTYYMSPEQARAAGEVDQRTDVWALGVVLYELLAGRRPFEGEEFLNVVHQILTSEPPRLATLRSGLPPGLGELVERAMSKDTARRFPTVEALAAALGPFAARTTARRTEASALTSTRPSPATSTQPGLEGKRRPAWLAGTILASGAAVTVMALVLMRRHAVVPASAPPVTAVPYGGATEALAPTRVRTGSVLPPDLSNEPTSPPPAAAASPSSARTRRRELGEVPTETTSPTHSRRPVDRDGHSLKLDPNPY